MNLFGLNKTNHNQDNDAKVRIELSESYSSLANTIAWRDLEAFLDILVQQSIKTEDQVNIQNLTLAEAAKGRGIREAVDKIRRHVSFYVSGG